MNYKSTFLSYLDSEGIQYQNIDEFIVKVTYGGDNLPSIPILLFFDKDGENYVSLKCWNLGKFSDSKIAAALVVFNALNSKFRWVKFYLDDEGDGAADMDAYVDITTVGPECLLLVRRMVNIIDSAYPEIMRAAWS